LEPGSCRVAPVKLIRFGEEGREEPGVLLPDGRRIDAGGEFRDYDEGFFASGGLEALAEWVADGCPGGGEVDPLARLGPPVDRPSKIVCVGKNYLEHAKELGEGFPSEPVLFLKASTSWSGPNDEVRIPPGAVKLDYEVELALVIGRTACGVDEREALDCVAGYGVFCDYSERAFQKEMGGQWTKGKSCDTFGPMGPWLVTADEVADPQKLRLWCRVNGEVRQNGWTGDMLFSVRQIVSYISRFMTLLPGDVVATGTPSGVAMGMTPPRYLQAGDLVECGIEGLGGMLQRVVAPRGS
jgi:2,4-diketo-3-deoxy-L-fuconate hydrolase